MAKLTNAQREAYITNGGVRCPFCKSGDIEGGSIDVDTGCCCQDMRCNACNERWTDDYTLTGITYEEELYQAEDMARAIWAETLAKSEGR